jgi:parvulin-like peptidyl-prolyl isomerase
MKKLTLFIAISALFLFYCGGKNKADNSLKDSDTKGTILAKVNGSTLTLEDLKLQIPAEYRAQLRGEDLKDAVETWINTQILAQEGIRKGLDKDPDVQAVIKFRTSDAIARRLIELDVTNKTSVLPAEIDSVYKAKKDSYKVDKEQVRASHILVATKDEADALYKRLQKGDDFAKLAKDYSGDRQSAANGGDIGFFSIEQVDPDFGKALSKLKIGEYSEPVKTSYGFHIIKLTDRLAAGSNIDSAQVKDEISKDLLKTKQGMAFNTLIDSLKKEAKIERLSPAGLNIPATPDSQ